MRRGRTIAIAAIAVLCSYAEEAFEPLFDGRTLNGWRVRERANATGQWLVEGSALTVAGRPGSLETVEQFADFDLRLEWKVGEFGNSGVFYRVIGEGNPATAAVEYQLADNARERSITNANRRAGAAYGLYAPSEDASLPPGQWNSLRIVARGASVRHWLNGRKVVDMDVSSGDFRQRAAAWDKGPEFAGTPAGTIVLQDHNSKVWFRNIRIRRLDGPPVPL